ncbi:MAG: SDR family NAD(P)-dependent oxidoreductase, partial [SAR202 cluster bacterium]|nr:SDR family NAD(P)-dependent oxidoreductase [SAR202 cluster bacterium]
MNSYKKIKIGDKAEITHTISKEDIEKFVELSGDDNKLHTDEVFASKTQYKKPVVHGMLGASFISTIIGTKLPGDGALWYSQNLEFLRPVRIGDKLSIVATVIKKIDRTKAIELQTDIFNQNKQKVTTGIAKVKVVEIKELKSEVKQINNKSALVIGGTGGIGQATCIQLAKDGFDVAIHYFKNRSKAESIRKHLKKTGNTSVIVSGDIVSSSDVEEIRDKSIRTFGNISVIVNCSAISLSNISFQNLKWEDMQAHYDANIKGSFNLLKIFGPMMIKDG